MKALVFERNLGRFAASRIVSTLGSGRGAGVGPLRLTDTTEPALPDAGWHRVQPLLSGICGSDLATLDGRSSRYFEELVSFPFVPGHEVVGRLTGDAIGATGQSLASGTRVVLEPVLGCVARGIDPPCAACATGQTGACSHVGFGHLRPGLQTGFCADTGGGWSAAGLVAHSSQLHPVPDSFSNAAAVTVEPIACAIHAVLHAGVREGDLVAVIGAGTVGLAVTAALSHLSATGRMASPSVILVGARYPHQRTLAGELGATSALEPDQLARAVRRMSSSLAIGSPSSKTLRLTGGADIVFDCVGSAESLASAFEVVAPRGRVVMIGMPGRTSVDLAPLWHREITLVGAYAYGTETVSPPDGNGRAPTVPVRTFDLAFEVVAAQQTGRFVTATYPIERFEEALAHAGAAGRRGAVKVAFDLGDSRSAAKGSAR